MTLADKTPRRIIVGGFFQRYEYLRPYKHLIRQSWLSRDAPARSAPDELTIHIRAGDIWLDANPHGRVHTDYHALPFSFYNGILTSRRWARVTIVTEDERERLLNS